MNLNLMEWSKNYELGIHQIDSQHRQLVDILNRIHGEYVKSLKGEIRPKRLVSEILDDLFDYTALHFGAEEALMRSHEYPDYDNHKASHERLLSSLTELHQRWLEGKLELEYLLDFVVAWLTRHVMGHDQLYVPYVKRSKNETE